MAVSAIVHMALIGLLLSGVFVTHQITQRRDARDGDSDRTLAGYLCVARGEESDQRRWRRWRSRCSTGSKGPSAEGRFTADNAASDRHATMKDPKLAVEPTVVVPPTVHLADNHIPTMGVNSAAVMPAAPPSNGTGSGGGIGSGSGGGVGVGHGPGIGAGIGGGIGGGVYKVGGGISAPTAISSPDPDYTEEARRAKKQGTCILWLIVDSTGHPRDIRVVRGLGSGWMPRQSTP